MDEWQVIHLKVSWNVQGPYDVNSVLKYTFERTESDDGTTCLEHNQTTSSYTIQLIPPQNAAASSENDNAHRSCEMWLSCQHDARAVAIEIESSSRNIEFYDDQGGYCSTVRGEKLLPGDNYEEREPEQGPIYRTKIVTERPLGTCSFKFLSLANKKQLLFKSLNVKLTHQSDDEAPSIGSGTINMARVRQMMSSMPQPVPERVENLMETVEQYQKNQASVMDNLQQAALTRTLGTKDPEANQMTGLMAILAKASSMQQNLRQYQPQHGMPSGRDSRSRQSNTSNRQDQKSSPQHPADAASERISGSLPTNESSTVDSTSDVLAKLMSALGTVGTDDDSAGASEVANSPDFYSAMQGMCRDLSAIKEQERRQEGGGGGDGEEKETSEIPQEKNQSPLHSSPLELRLAGYVAAMEERIMGRLERKLTEVKDHLDVRLNRLEALLVEQSQQKASAKKEELQVQDLD